jgi:hypothetical protein
MLNDQKTVLVNRNYCAVATGVPAILSRQPHHSAGGGQGRGVSHARRTHAGSLGSRRRGRGRGRRRCSHGAGSDATGYISTAPAAAVGSTFVVARWRQCCKCNAVWNERRVGVGAVCARAGCRGCTRSGFIFIFNIVTKLLLLLCSLQKERAESARVKGHLSLILTELESKAPIIAAQVC